MYSILKEVSKPHLNILTAEDPVEYELDGVGQVQIKDDIGLTFSAALRSFLRQDPEIILVGEMRDCLLYTSPSPRDGLLSRMPSSA